MATVVVFIRGGVFQHAVADQPDLALLIVDYDDEACGGSAARTAPVVCDKDVVARAAAGHREP